MPSAISAACAAPDQLRHQSRNRLAIPSRHAGDHDAPRSAERTRPDGRLPKISASLFTRARSVSPLKCHSRVFARGHHARNHREAESFGNELVQLTPGGRDCRLDLRLGVLTGDEEAQPRRLHGHGRVDDRQNVEAFLEQVLAELRRAQQSPTRTGQTAYPSPSPVSSPAACAVSRNRWPLRFRRSLRSGSRAITSSASSAAPATGGDRPTL